MKLVNQETDRWKEDYEDYDYATERPLILEEMAVEIQEVDDETLRAELEANFVTLQATEDEDAFWDAVDEGYEWVDQFYGHEDEDEEEEEWFDFDFWDDEDEDSAEEDADDEQ